MLAVFALLASTVGPAQAATTYEVKVTNLTSQTFSMVFTGKGGLGVFTFTMKPGVNLVKLPAGKFTYRYTSCGKSTSGEYTVLTKGNEKIMIKACPPGYNAGPATTGSTTSSTTYEVKVSNQTGMEFKITFTGASVHTFTLKPGVNYIKLPAGKYKFRYSACGDNTTGNYTVQTKNNPKLEIKACKGVAMTSIQFENSTGGSMSITLVGPTTYRLTLPTGKTTVKVIKGSYTYSVWSVCGSTSGTIKLTATKFWA